MTIHLVSVSGGKDSTATLAMALELHGHENVLGCFADTGNEHESTYDYVRYLEDATGVPIKWFRRDWADDWAHRIEYVRTQWPLKGVADAVIQCVLSVLELGPTGNPFLDLSILKGRFPSRRALTPDQLKWHREWNGGTLAVVDSPEAALRVLGVMAPESENRNQHELTAAL